MPERDAWPWPADHRPAETGDDLAAAFARCFRGGDGDRALAHLRAITVARRPPPDIDAASLRHLEGQRWLVGHIEALIARGGGRLPPHTTAMPTEE